jgi:heme-degrading monooxygenase HmoA
MTVVGQPCTAGSWHVHAGREKEFIAAWTDFTTWSLEQMPGAESFVLIRHRAEPQRFLSFGAWSDTGVVEAWRNSDGFREHLGRCRALCEQFEGHDYEVAAAPPRSKR